MMSCSITQMLYFSCHQKVVASELGISDDEMSKRIAELQILLPDMVSASSRNRKVVW